MGAQLLHLKQENARLNEQLEHCCVTVVQPLQEKLKHCYVTVVQPLQEENQRLHALIGSMKEGFQRYGPFWNGTTDIGINLTSLIPRAKHYNANVPNQFIRDIPEMLWWQKILQPFLNLEDVSILRLTNPFFQSYWESILAQNVIRVPQGCPTLENAMAMAVVFSTQKVYTKINPLEIQMDKGVHEIVGHTNEELYNAKSSNVPCSHITFVGKGKDQTTIRGGFRVENQQNVKFEELTVANSDGLSGLHLEGMGTNVDVLNCAVNDSGWGMQVLGGASVTATHCEFMKNSQVGVVCEGLNSKATLNECTIHHNREDGLNASDHAVVDLHGSKTDIHSNQSNGITAEFDGKVNIHLPAQHNSGSSHGNGVDRHVEMGGSIANINDDGTFTHVVDEW